LWRCNRTVSSSLVYNRSYNLHIAVWFRNVCKKSLRTYKLNLILEYLTGTLPNVSQLTAGCQIVSNQLSDVKLIFQATTPQSFNVQGCFAIDYDFATHRCYFFPVNVLLDLAKNIILVHCVFAAGVPQPSSQGLRPNPTVVHITLCKTLLLSQ